MWHVATHILDIQKLNTSLDKNFSLVSGFCLFLDMQANMKRGFGFFVSTTRQGGKIKQNENRVKKIKHIRLLVVAT